MKSVPVLFITKEVVDDGGVRVCVHLLEKEENLIVGSLSDVAAKNPVIRRILERTVKELDRKKILLGGS